MGMGECMTPWGLVPLMIEKITNLNEVPTIFFIELGDSFKQGFLVI